MSEEELAAFDAFFDPAIRQLLAELRRERARAERADAEVAQLKRDRERDRDIAAKREREAIAARSRSGTWRTRSAEESTMADCIECYASLAEGEWSVHADRATCYANMRAAAHAMSLRIADLEAQLADAEVMRRETVALCERVDEARPLGGDARAVLDAIRAVPWEDLHEESREAFRRVLNESGERVFEEFDEARAEAIRARLLAAGEAAAEGMVRS